MKESADFMRIFGANITENQSVKNGWFRKNFSGQISLEIDKFCADYSSMFYVACCGDEVSR